MFWTPPAPEGKKIELLNAPLPSPASRYTFVCLLFDARQVAYSELMRAFSPKEQARKSDQQHKRRGRFTHSALKRWIIKEIDHIWNR